MAASLALEWRRLGSVPDVACSLAKGPREQQEQHKPYCSCHSREFEENSHFLGIIYIYIFLQ